MRRLVIHAPTPEALERARRNARNLLALMPEAEVEIVANGGAVAASLDKPDETDAHLVLCRNSLVAARREAGERRSVEAAVVHILDRQNDGWAYVRA